MIFNRLNRAWLLVRCLLQAAWRGPARGRRPADLTRVVVVPTGKLGDIVCTTPVLRALRSRLSSAQIIVAGASRLQRPILADSGLVDEYWDLENPGALNRLREKAVEVAIITGPSFVPTALAYLAGIPLVVAPAVLGGYSPAETKLYKILKRLVTTFPYQMRAYAPRERLRALEPLGIFSDDTKKHLGFSTRGAAAAERFLATARIKPGQDLVIGVSPTAGNKIKEWPAERFAEVINYLNKKYGAKVILTGELRDREKVRAVIGQLSPGVAAVDATADLDHNLDLFKALISKLDLFISVDSGPIYIAEAFDVPTVDIIGPIDEREQPPQGRRHRNVLPPRRSQPELFVLNARHYNKAEVDRQVDSITVLAVTREIDSLIDYLKLKS